jgi:adenylate kinase
MEKHEKIHTIKTWLGSGSINIFGRPFAGKDTQGRMLEKLFGGAMLGGGDILRGGTMPDPIKSAMHTGKLIPSEDYVGIVLPYLMKDEFKNIPLILSSVGRWSGEEIGVIDATNASNHSIKAVIYLDLDEDGVRQRWQNVQGHSDRGVRHDDTKEILEIRLKEFHDKTLPVIDYYQNLGNLLLISADATPEAISEAIIDGLYRKSLV